MIPKKQRLSDEELKKLIDAYNVAKDKKTLIRINCVIAWGKGWEWSMIEDILMVSKDVIDDAIGKYTLWRYAKNEILQVYYEEKEKFKSRIKEFFEEDIKDKLIKLELKTFIGTSFQIISG